MTSSKSSFLLNKGKIQPRREFEGKMLNQKKGSVMHSCLEKGNVKGLSEKVHVKKDACSSSGQKGVNGY